MQEEKNKIKCFYSTKEAALQINLEVADLQTFLRVVKFPKQAFGYYRLTDFDIEKLKNIIKSYSQ